MLTVTISLRIQGETHRTMVTWFDPPKEPQVVLTERVTEPLLHIKRDTNFSFAEITHGTLASETTQDIVER